MGVVYEAYDHELQCRVALKTLRQLTPDTLARFKREFRSLQGVHHPNLVRLGELISTGDEWFFTMELVEGDDFLAFVRPADPRRQSLMQVSPKISSSNRDNLETAPTARFGRNIEAVDAGDAESVRFDDERLRASLRQLGEALAKLHEEGIVHRDVKPSNIRVDENTGRVVLLDFGLVANLDSGASSSDHRVVGTPAYMAPEQAKTEAVGPEADLYSTGVVLYEALTGRLPFEGNGIEILVAKQRQDAPRVSEQVKGVAPDLEELCTRLLQRDPSKRPTAARLARAMQSPTERSKTMPPPMSHSAPPFVGRDAELDLLEKALDEVRSVQTVSVLVQGESGVGKSSLVRRFLDAHAKDANTCILTGRCYEREAVPYKAFDGVIDSLTRFLMHLPSEEARALLPTKPGPLVQVFPVLRRVTAVAALTTTPLPPMDPLELRDRAFAGLRDLLIRLASRYSVIISIDDAQWADADSIALLAEVLRPPEAPNLLFLATVRTTSGPSASVNHSLHSGGLTQELRPAIPGDLRVVDLSRLTHAHACEMARSILEGAEGDEHVSAAWVAEEADGHPLFIDALARYSLLHAGSERRVAVRLDEAISAPIQRLQDNERRILELLAMSSGPVSQDVLATAAELAPDPFARGMAVLRAGHLVTTSGSRGSDTVELYHDRIRVAVKQKVRREKRPELHRRLAMALETGGSGDAQALAGHWYGANEPQQAARYAKMAADHATHALAFDRAATLYDWALRLDAGTEEDRQELYERLGNALASAGRGVRAAQAFRKAARRANAARALDLRRRAADQLLRAGHIDEGLDAMRGVLAAIGMRLPQTRIATLLAFFYWLVVVRIRGLSFKRQDTSQIAAHELTRIDTCWSVALGLSITDTVRGAVFHNRTLVLSLRAGETYRVARAVALHAGFIATSGGRRGWGRAQKMLQRARDLAEESREPHAIGWAAGAACVAHYTTGRFTKALEYFQVAERTWRECPGTAWELDTIKVFAINSMAQLGQLSDLCARAPRYLRETLERGDLYGAVNLRIGYANLRWLVADRPDEARREIDEAMEQWSKQGMHLEHFYELLARANLALYEGSTAEGLALLQKRWGGLDRALLFRVQSIRILARFMRARLQVAEGIARGKDGAPLLAAAERDARAIASERMAWSQPLARLIQAACARANGETSRAMDGLRVAVTEFETADMQLHAVVARAALGEMIGGDEGARMASEASLWMRREGVVAPAKLAATLGPGLGAWK